MRTLFRHLTSLYLVTSLLAWLPAGANGTVLCFEPDGTVCIEDGSVCCSTSRASSVRALAPSAAEADACGPCIDVQLGGQTGRPAPVVSSVPAPAATPLLPAAATFVAAPPCASLRGAHSTAPPGARFEILRSTILRN